MTAERSLKLRWSQAVMALALNRNRCPPSPGNDGGGCCAGWPQGLLKLAGQPGPGACSESRGLH